MPKANPILTNWTGGELGPNLYGRVDTQKYQNGAKTIENFIVIPSGGVKKRPGSKFVWYAMSNSTQSRLVPFIYNAEQTYVLEFYENKIRFFSSQGIVTDTAKGISGITQANPGVVTATAHGLANGDKVAIVSISGMTELNNREFTVANKTADTFELSGIDTTSYTAWSGGGTVAKIIEVTTTYTAAECLELEVTQSADTLFIAHENHALAKLVRSAATTWTLSNVGVIRGPWRSLNVDETITIDANTNTGAVTLTASSTLFYSAHVGSIWKLYTPTRTNGESEFGIGSGNVNATEYWSYNGNVYYISAVSAGTANGNYNPPTHKQGTVTLYATGAAAGASADVEFVHSGYGIVTISAYTSETSIDGTVYEGYGYNELPLQMSNNGNARYAEPTKFWQEGAWSDYRGYPSNVVLFEQRLWATKVQTFYGSVTGNFADFEEGPNADQALNYTIGSEQADVIRWIVPAKQLLVGTTSAEYVIGSSSLGEAITPQNIKVSRETAFGSSNCNAVRVGNAVLFMQRRGDPDNAGRKMREMAYSFEIDGYVSNDMTLFAPHITGTGVTRLSYQADPDNLIWAVREDGHMAALTYERSQEVTAWHRHIIGGSSDVNGTDTVVEDVTSIPGADGDELWMKVKRYVNGGTVRYIEVLSYFDDDTAIEDGVFVDGSITYDGASTTTVSGLWPQRGETVTYLADGVAGTGSVSATGKLTISPAASKVHVGWAYDSVLETLDIEAGAAAGTSQGRRKRISDVTLRLNRSQGGTVGTSTTQDDIDYDDATLYTGDKVVSLPNGWAASSGVYIKHSDPLPFSVIALMPEQNTTG